MGNPNPKNVSTTSPALWVEQQIDDWIKARIRGRRWHPVEPEKPSFLRKPEVLRRVGLSNVTLWLMEKRGEFPQRLHLENALRRDVAAEAEAAE